MGKKKSNPAGVPPAMQMQNPAMSVGGPPMASMPPKKGKKKKGAQLTQEQMMVQNLSPEQMTQLQLEEAIKESQNPAMRLKKLKSPLSIKSCFLNLLFLIILTLVVVFVLVAFLPSVKVDKFNLGVLFNNMFDKFGIFRFFKRIGDWFASWGKGKEAFLWLIQR